MFVYDIYFSYRKPELTFLPLAKLEGVGIYELQARAPVTMTSSVEAVDVILAGLLSLLGGCESERTYSDPWFPFT